MKEKKKENWFSCLMNYAEGCRGSLALSVFLSVISVVSGLLPYYCVYRMIELFTIDAVTTELLSGWGIGIILSYAVKIIMFGLSTGSLT